MENKTFTYQCCYASAGKVLNVKAGPLVVEKKNNRGVYQQTIPNAYNFPA